MRQAGDGAHGARMRALIVLLWRAGLRINEALTLTKHSSRAHEHQTSAETGDRAGRPPTSM